MTLKGVSQRRIPSRWELKPNLQRLSQKAALSRIPSRWELKRKMQHITPRIEPCRIPSRWELKLVAFYMGLIGLV